MAGAPGPAAIATAASPATAERGASAIAVTVPDITAVTGRWDDLVARAKVSGKALLGAALESAAPVAITKAGDLTITLDEPNDFHAKAIEQARDELVAILSEWFGGIRSVRLGRDGAAATPAEKPARMTDDMVKAQRLTALRRKAPLLDAAIEVLDLDVVE